ncbi:hypothetical protein IYW40_04955 [Methylocystis sp. H4A]|uniref:hypothetical protein n=1 Tax=Methylocystis sp. H4A TaxID=2785788 RepID=UPI001A29CF6E|nr:hypothetical protein [Methylocystis sp. H4A]MBG0800839.1 hypothetical protein [Methylocystis sp. H4A]
MTKKRTVAKADQYAEFIDAAKSLGCDEDPAHFDAALKKVARHKASPDAPAKNPAKDKRK